MVEVWEVHVKAQCWCFPLLFSVLLVQGLLCRRLGSTRGLLPPAVGFESCTRGAMLRRVPVAFPSAPCRRAQQRVAAGRAPRWQSGRKDGSNCTGKIKAATGAGTSQ